MSRWVYLRWFFLTRSVTHDIEQTSNFAMIRRLILLDRLINFLHKFPHKLVTQSLPDPTAFLFNNSLSPPTLQLSRIPVPISIQLKLHIFIDSSRFRRKLPAFLVLLVIDTISVLKPNWLWIIRNLSHFIQKSQIVLVFPFLQQEDVGFLKFKTFAMFLNIQGKSIPQPIQYLMSRHRSRVTLRNDCFQHIRISLIDYRILHEQELSIGNRLHGH